MQPLLDNPDTHALHSAAMWAQLLLFLPAPAVCAGPTVPLCKLLTDGGGHACSLACTDSCMMLGVGRLCGSAMQRFILINTVSEAVAWGLLGLQWVLGSIGWELRRQLVPRVLLEDIAQIRHVCRDGAHHSDSSASLAQNTAVSWQYIASVMPTRGKDCWLVLQ